MSTGPSTTIAEPDRKELLGLARRSIVSSLKRGQAPAAPSQSAGLNLRRVSGVFVTIRRDGQLRGCIGIIKEALPLAETVARCAVSSATQDDRFSPVTQEELDQCLLEISVLTSPREVSEPAEVVIGRHGVIVSRGGLRGVLLPSVASERGWDRETFLSQACRKAGLREDAWRSGARIEVFEAEAFGEPGY
jgi:AmmeMemoRadiSam system protein A